MHVLVAGMDGVRLENLKINNTNSKLKKKRNFERWKTAQVFGHRNKQTSLGQREK
jgi:hypothetical protein